MADIQALRKNFSDQLTQATTQIGNLEQALAGVRKQQEQLRGAIFALETVLAQDAQAASAAPPAAPVATPAAPDAPAPTDTPAAPPADSSVDTTTADAAPATTQGS